MEIPMSQTPSAQICPHNRLVEECMSVCVCERDTVDELIEDYGSQGLWDLPQPVGEENWDNRFIRWRNTSVPKSGFADTHRYAGGWPIYTD